MDKIELAFEHASYYAWGRQDSAGVMAELDVVEFGAAWRLLTEAFETQRSHYMPTMRDAYDAWNRDGRLSFKVGRGEWWIVRDPSGTWKDKARIVPVPNVARV